MDYFDTTYYRPVETFNHEGYELTTIEMEKGKTVHDETRKK